MSDAMLSREERQQQLLERQAVLKGLILRLHAGEDQAVIQEEFNQHFTGISAYEIQMMEKGLMQEGISIEEIMALCHIHATLMKDAVSDMKTNAEVEKPGHPVQVLKRENLAIDSTIDRVERLLETCLNDDDDDLHKGLLRQSQLLGQFDKHYARKEYCFFPIMERYGITAPPKVMWGVDDLIRDMYKHYLTAVEEKDITQATIAFAPLKEELQGMMIKEEDILVPMVLSVFNEDDWLRIAEESASYGYCIVAPEAVWQPERTTFATAAEAPVAQQPEDTAEASADVNISLSTGYLTPQELDAMLNHLPLELSFVDANNIVKYYNEGLGEEKVFPRSPSAIGRDVINCHPPRIHGIVSALLDDLKHGRKDQETMWFRRKDQFIHVTYRAVRDASGTFLGTLEYVQNIQGFIDLTDEKRDVSPHTKKDDQ